MVGIVPFLIDSDAMRKGKVYLIGAGPGDPGLLTLRARDILSRADVIVYDALLNPRLLEWTKPAAVKIFAGKRHRKHGVKQADINEILLRHVQRGRQVARLKGGDPFLFARGGEEAAFLHDHGIAYEVIPGVSSASAASAYAGIPLTDRRLSSMVTLVTGHEGEDKASAPVDWSRISRQSTLVIFMGLDQLSSVTDRLLHHNWDRQMPAAVIQSASWTSQRVVEGTLGDIAAQASEAKVSSPALIIIGRVVSLRKIIKWFELRPLSGKRIVITRAAEQAPEFAHILEDLGAEVIAFPTIQIVPPKDWRTLDQALKVPSQWDWILFTSVNGVAMFFSRLRALGKDIRDLKGARIGAIGPKTSGKLTALGLKVDAFPQEYRAEALADVIGKVKGQRVLLARAEEARDVLPKTLQARGAAVTIAPVYRTLKTRRMALDIKQRILAGDIDVVTFTSSSTVDGFMAHFSARQKRMLFAQCKAAVIGPITAATLKTYGISSAIRAPRYTIEALAKAIVKTFS